MINTGRKGVEIVKVAQFLLSESTWSKGETEQLQCWVVPIKDL